MNNRQTKLYSFAAPFALLLPVMDFHFNNIPNWFAGTEFLSVFADILIQLFTGLADTIIAIFVGGAFGMTGA